MDRALAGPGVLGSTPSRRTIIVNMFKWFINASLQVSVAYFFIIIFVILIFLIVIL